MTLKAEKFEELLASELQRTLDPQRGKALAAFRAQVAEEAQRPAVAGAIKPARDITRGETWFWASVPSLVAACLAVVVTLKLLGAATTGAGGVATQGTDSAAIGGKGDDLPRVSIVSRVEQRQETTPDGMGRHEETQWIEGNSNYRLTSDEQIVPVEAPF